jgi:hypothetical protein
MDTVSFPPQVPPTLFEELSLFVRRMPSWLFAMLALLVIFILYQFVGGVLTLLLFGIHMADGDVTGFRIATMAAQIVFLLVPTMILARLRFPHVRNVFRLGGVRPMHIILTILAVFALQQLLQTYMLLQESIPIELPPALREVIDQLKQMMEQMYRLLTAADSFGEFLFVVLVIAVTPAVCEELLFRGLIQRTLEEPTETHVASAEERKKRGLRAAVIGGVIFGLYHLNPFTLVPLAALGVYFGFVVYRTRTIGPAIAAHFFNNFLACLAIYLRLDENFIAVSPTERPTALMLAVNVAWSAVVFVVATYYLVRITNSLHQSQAGSDVPSSNPTPA